MTIAIFITTKGWRWLPDAWRKYDGLEYGVGWLFVEVQLLTGAYA